MKMGSFQCHHGNANEQIKLESQKRRSREKKKIRTENSKLVETFQPIDSEIAANFK